MTWQMRKDGKQSGKGKRMLKKLQEEVRDRKGFIDLDEYYDVALAFLQFLKKSQPTRIISPSTKNYIFFQYSREFEHKVTRPLNSNLFIEDEAELKKLFHQFMEFLSALKKHKENVIKLPEFEKYIKANSINRVIYTLQQSVGSIGDSFENANQSRKRAGQLFENLISLILRTTGLECEPRRVKIPLPNQTGRSMSYELDMVFSRNKAIITSESRIIGEHEIVGSVKTTSKDRIDKIFLDKFLLERLLGYKVPVIAIFLHDVQRARKGTNEFGINSTFKSNHFLGYTLALNKLDGVYYVDPRPEFTTNLKLLTLA